MLNHQESLGILPGEGLLYYKIVFVNGVNKNLPFQQVSKKECFLSISGIISVYVILKMQQRIRMYYYLKEKLESESKMISKYSPLPPNNIMFNSEQHDKGKGKGKCVEKSPIDYIAEDLTCAIVCETVGDFYQLNCQHIISSKAL